MGIARMQLALMSNASSIRQHADKGKWVKTTHRTHVPLLTSDDTYFMSRTQSAWIRIPSKKGVAFEVNNAIPHLVKNYGRDRIHLIIDWSERDLEIVKLRKGQ